MPTDAKLAAVLLLGACASSSISSDLGRVRSLARVPALPAVADADVDPQTSVEARALLREPLDADSAVRIALLNNRELRAQLRELGIPRGRLAQAGLLPNPLFEVEVLPERQSSVELRVEYDLTSLVLAPLRAKAAEADLEAERFRAAGDMVELGYHVRTAFYALAAAEQRLVIGERALDAFAAGRDAAVALLQAGNISQLDASSQIVAYERARITIAQLELDVADKRERMQRLLGLHGEDTTWRIRSPLPPVPEKVPAFERPEARAIEASLELAATRNRLLALARRTGVARTQGWLPDVAADVHALQGNPEDASGGTDRSWQFGAGVSVSVPLFDRQQGTTRALEAEFDALLERYQGMATDIRSAVRDARNRVVSAHARALKFQEVILPAQRTVTEQTLLQYNAMQVAVFQLLQARRDELDVELAYVDTLREYWSAAAALDALFGGRRVTPIGTAGAASLSAGTDSQGGH